jgi:hypothetical protein
VRKCRPRSSHSCLRTSVGSFDFAVSQAVLSVKSSRLCGQTEQTLREFLNLRLVGPLPRYRTYFRAEGLALQRLALVRVRRPPPRRVPRGAPSIRQRRRAPGPRPRLSLPKMSSGRLEPVARSHRGRSPGSVGWASAACWLLEAAQGGPSPWRIRGGDVAEAGGHAQRA